MNDIDDYKCYKTNPIIDSIRIFTNTPKMAFKVFCNVYYVNPTTPEVVSTVRTWHKRLDIKVTSPAMSNYTGSVVKYDTIKMSTITSYWYFR